MKITNLAPKFLHTYRNHFQDEFQELLLAMEMVHTHWGFQHMPSLVLLMDSWNSSKKVGGAVDQSGSNSDKKRNLSLFHSLVIFKVTEFGLKKRY